MNFPDRHSPDDMLAFRLAQHFDLKYSEAIKWIDRIREETKNG